MDGSTQKILLKKPVRKYIGYKFTFVKKGIFKKRFPLPTHQEKTCEDITPYGVITQFPKNGRLFTPKYRFITPSTFDHTEKNLFTPSIFKITSS
jgi:hypothetical protein